MTTMENSAFQNLRTAYHAALLGTVLGHRPNTTVFSNADGSSQASTDIAARLAKKMGTEFCMDPPSGQGAGSRFTRLTLAFLRDAFGLLQHIRPGDWGFTDGQGKVGITAYYQYEHLRTLKLVLDQHNDLKAALGGDYFITPDIVIFRKPVDDAEINRFTAVVNPATSLASHTPLRSFNNTHAILHASISCKWTMRSDRAQNTRTEALNLIRNRKGPLPHIVAVTFEPLPTRLASIAMGTGDLDCVYHGALPELVEAVDESGRDESAELLHTLVDGRRLRDISDLPFDISL